ncbi:MAG: hypothetical protein Q8R30_04280 [bacterium]|nr:hypothetical protein [bacterium]MDZ4260169.1 hypothetical protein [Candidatus Sungbacteria bacterium]
MSNGVIDLRKKTSGKRSHNQPAPRQAALPPPESPTFHESVLLPDQFDLEWLAYEHEYRVRSRYWFLYPLAIATSSIIYGIIAHNYLFVAFVAVSFMILTYYMKRLPRVFRYGIERRGVWIEDRLIDFSKIKSFWIFTHSLMAPELLLETHNPINPILYIRLENVDVHDVHEAMSQYVPEKEQQDSMFSQIARIIGL